MSGPGSLARAWRVVRTGSAFALFFAGGALLALALPLARRLAGDPAGFDLRAQRAIRRGYRLFMGYMRFAGLTRVRLEGAEALRAAGPRVVVANHPTLIDTPLLAALLPQADCIANPEWADAPLLRGAIRAANYVRNDAGLAAVEEGVRRLREGRTLLIFPEGTRTPEDAALGSLRRGAAHIALRAGVDLLPVAITCRPRTLMKGQRWHDVPDRPFELTVRVLPPIAPRDVVAGGASASVSARRLTEALRERLLDALREAPAPA
jgi:1-acyl-sn-glycerol-3-phosphate acyltransferase